MGEVFEAIEHAALPKRVLYSDFAYDAEDSHLDQRLIVQNHVQQGTVHFQAATVVVNEAQFTKFVHEEAHARARCADHLRERLLADIRNRDTRRLVGR